jgi:hypothetical protein
MITAQQFIKQLTVQQYQNISVAIYLCVIFLSLSYIVLI